MRTFKAMYYAGTSLSMLVGLWHFFVPWMFEWFSYIPDEYRLLDVTISYVNLCFSLLLFGLSLIVLLWGKKVFSHNREAVTLYGFLTFVWVFRVVISILIPCPPETNVWMNYGQLAGSALIVLLLLVPFAKVVRSVRR